MIRYLLSLLLIVIAGMTLGAVDGARQVQWVLEIPGWCRGFIHNHAWEVFWAGILLMGLVKFVLGIMELRWASRVASALRGPK